MLTVVASDMGTPHLTTEVDVNITVIDMNDNPPVLTSIKYHPQVPSDAKTGKATLTILKCSQSQVGFH